MREESIINSWWFDVTIRSIVRQEVRGPVFEIDPNYDAGCFGISPGWAGSGDRPKPTHLPRNEYLDLLSRSQVIVGNSSSGIIEVSRPSPPAYRLCQSKNWIPQQVRNDPQ